MGTSISLSPESAYSDVRNVCCLPALASKVLSRTSKRAFALFCNAMNLSLTHTRMPAAAKPGLHNVCDTNGTVDLREVFMNTEPSAPAPPACPQTMHAADAVAQRACANIGGCHSGVGPNQQRG